MRTAKAVQLVYPGQLSTSLDYALKMLTKVLRAHSSLQEVQQA